MRLRHIPGSEEEIANSPYVVSNPEEKKGRWNGVFGNDNPIEIEVGMGKGRFIMELAAKNPEINYVGIERYCSVPSERHPETPGDGAFQYLLYVCGCERAFRDFRPG